jgi:hypothetical protein
MIDIQNEKLVLVSDLPKRLPKRGNKYVHISAVYRWMKQGCAGVRLETVFYCGNRYTSEEAVNRFWQSVTAAKDGKLASCKSRKPSNASKELDEAGW